MQGSVLAETEAFITRQREALLQQRQELLNQQKAIQQQLDELEEMLGKFDVFEGKAARPRKQTGSRRASGTRRALAASVRTIPGGACPPEYTASRRSRG